jgi:homoserine kinase type II
MLGFCKAYPLYVVVCLTKGAATQNVFKEGSEKFSMAQYVQLREDEIREVTSKYGLDLFAYHPIEEGAANTSFLIETHQGQYILTVFELELQRVQNLSKLLQLMEKNKFPTSRILPTSNENESILVQGHAVLLKHFIGGQVVRDLDEDMISQVGAAIAELHTFSCPNYLPRQHPYGKQTFPALFDQGIDPEYEKWLAQRYEVLMKGMSTGLPRGLIHGDVFFDNVLFDGSKLKAIIDFEEACNYYLVCDLGMAVLGLCTLDSKVNLPKARALIDGYQQTRKLEAEERETLQLSVEYAAIATSSWRFWKYNIDTPIAEKSQAHTQMAKIAKHVSQIRDSVFLEVVFGQ